jgi:hypothetical protein
MQATRFLRFLVPVWKKVSCPWSTVILAIGQLGGRSEVALLFLVEVSAVLDLSENFLLTLRRDVSLAVRCGHAITMYKGTSTEDVILGWRSA